MSTIKSLLQLARQYLVNDDIIMLDVELLLCHLLKVERSYLFAHDDEVVSDDKAQDFENLLKRRLEGEPISHLIGHREFWSLDFKINEKVLTPRPETELLIECILKQFPKEHPLSIVDLGTGPGTIALSLAKECPRWSLLATDISEDALNVAKQNAENLGITNIRFAQGEWLKALPSRRFDLIISNPPYIKSTDPCLYKPPLSFEPQIALNGGLDGLDAFRSIISGAGKYLTNSACIFLEHGYTQASEIKLLLKQAGFQSLRTYTDLNQNDRVTSGQWLNH